MRRLILLLASTAALTSCFEWKGDGTDEVLPDVIGQASGGKIKPSFGVPSQSLNDSAAEDIKNNRRPAEETAEEPAGHGEGAKHGEAPKAHE